MDQRRYRKLYVRLWRHPDFVGMKDAEKVVAMYLLTGPQTNRLGCYVFSPALAAEDIGCSIGMMKGRTAAVCEAFGWLWDQKTRVLWIPSWFEWNRPDNEKVLIGALKDTSEIPPCPLLARCLRNVSDTFPGWYAKPLFHGSAYQEQEQEQEQKTDQKQEPRTLKAVR